MPDNRPTQKPIQPPADLTHTRPSPRPDRPSPVTGGYGGAQGLPDATSVNRPLPKAPVGKEGA
jgi:hypothetical protein